MYYVNFNRPVYLTKMSSNEYISPASFKFNRANISDDNVAMIGIDNQANVGGHGRP